MKYESTPFHPLRSVRRSIFSYSFDIFTLYSLGDIGSIYQLCSLYITLFSMRILAAILPLLAVVSAAHNSPYGRHRRHARAVEQPHANIARSNEAHAQAVRVIKRKVRQRGQTCRPRVADAQAHLAVGQSSSSISSSTSSSTSSTSSWAEPTYSATYSTWSAEPTYAAASAPPAPPAPSPPAPSPPAPAPAPDNGAQYGTNDGNCGWSNAGPDAPNGSEDWLNCGLEGAGWTPPFLGLGDIKAAPLTADGIFAPCAPYFWAFEQYGGEFGSRSRFTWSRVTASA